ncbi:MAG: HEAT repeat domain-containing protein [Planctomycetes bacterium]|nr:HEAT repeat domain-containing protein [Planctomycetota bacterium]
MKHSWAFALFLGGVLGAVGAIVSTDPGAEPREAPAAPVAPAQVAPPSSAVPNLIGLADDLDDQALARELERAHFERDWARTAAVATVLRGRSGAPGREAGAPGEAAAAPPSLVRLDHEYRRATLQRERDARRNAATRLVADGWDDDVERRLAALFSAAALEPEDEVARVDAAHLLARYGGPGARAALVEALEGPDPARSELAALALARADQPAGLALLVTALTSDRDDALRARVADALVEARALLDDAGGAVGALTRVALADRDPGVRTHALATLARADLADLPAARAALARLVLDEAEDAPVRAGVVATLRAHHAIARALPPDLVDALLTALDRTTGPLRVEVIAALGEAAPGEALPRLDAAALAATAPQEREALLDAARAVRARAPEPR